jgi:hypothetical protein
MSQPDRRVSPPRNQVLNWLDPSSEWAQEDYGAQPTAASEPYDWTLKDGQIRSTQVIPITSAVRSNSSMFQWLKRKTSLLDSLKRKANAPETSRLIPVKKDTARKVFRKRITGLLRPLPTSPLVESDATIPLDKGDVTNPLAESDATKVRRRTPGLTLLLLLSVIALFIFAYIAQK